MIHIITSHGGSLFLAGHQPAAASYTVILSFSLLSAITPIFPYSLLSECFYSWVLIGKSVEIIFFLQYHVSRPTLSLFLITVTPVDAIPGHSELWSPTPDRGPVWKSNSPIPQGPTLPFPSAVRQHRGAFGHSLAYDCKKKCVLCFPNEDKFQTILTLRVL